MAHQQPSTSGAASRSASRRSQPSAPSRVSAGAATGSASAAGGSSSRTPTWSSHDGGDSDEDEEVQGEEESEEEEEVPHVQQQEEIGMSQMADAPPATQPTQGRRSSRPKRAPDVLLQVRMPWGRARGRPRGGEGLADGLLDLICIYGLVWT